MNLRIGMMMEYLLAIFLSLGFQGVLCIPLPRNDTIQCYLDNPAVQRFREYVQIDTSRQENLERAVTFWRRQAAELGLEFTVHRPAGLPVCVMTWRGTDPELSSIMLNSHMDVVPADAELWKHPPFSAHIDDNGDIYGRGTQDCKDVAIQYVEAIRRLKKDNVTLKRTVHVTVMPDEETGGFDGMVKFVNTTEFKKLNIGFAFDEGGVSSDENMFVVYQDKRPWQLNITVKGTGGHGSSMFVDTATQKLKRIMYKIDTYRDRQMKILNANGEGGTYDSVNINIINIGLAQNVIPTRGYMVVDIRWAFSKPIDDMQKLVDTWVAEGGIGTEVKYLRRMEVSEGTPFDESLPYMQAIQEVAKEMNISIIPSQSQATSDMVNLRNMGIPALGFSTKTYTTNRYHAPNEYLNVNTLLKGIDIFANLIPKLGNLNNL